MQNFIKAPKHEAPKITTTATAATAATAETTATTATTAATTTTTTLDPAKLIVQLSKRINKVISERTREQKAKTDETTFSIQNRFVVGPKNFFFEKP